MGYFTVNFLCLCPLPSRYNSPRLREALKSEREALKGERGALKSECGVLKSERVTLKDAASSTKIATFIKA